MDAIFTISINSKTYDPQRLLLNLKGKINLRKNIYIYIYILLYQISSFTMHGKHKEMI